MCYFGVCFDVVIDKCFDVIGLEMFKLRFVWDRVCFGEWENVIWVIWVFF